MRYVQFVASIGILAALSQALAQVPLESLSREKRVGIEVMKVDERRYEAVVEKDAAVLQRMHADEYLRTDRDGATWTKAQDIANIRSGALSLASFKLEDMKAQVDGLNEPITVVVTGRNTITGTFKGKDISGAYRFTDVLVFRDQRWQCVTTQVTLVAQK